MQSTTFDEENGVLDKPADMTADTCASLSVWRGENAGGIPVVVSCWKPSKQELAEIERTGRVWLTIAGRTMPPVDLSGHSPWTPEPPADPQDIAGVEPE